MEEIKNTLIKASKIYSDQTLVRAGINAIPIVGGSLDILLSSAGQTFVIKRIGWSVSWLYGREIFDKSIVQEV